MNPKRADEFKKVTVKIFRYWVWIVENVEKKGEFQ
jgi:hypothetical protein